ncbi:hypothetical protein HPB52_020723 [Rhipicephalus sanguineus]|uniref:Uncharacterized protein n=2 Tax=Rhipicephalus sanguineus TaxID=34632 RepID=A0A9D4TBK8_RHISA|nr:hypothetical protein HPB52_020723 [Rhipicephalus sanguineus]
MVMSCLRSVIREEAQALRLEFFRQTGITAGAGDMRPKNMDDNADLRLVEDALASYADQWADLEGVTDCFTAGVFKYRSSCSETFRPDSCSDTFRPPPAGTAGFPVKAGRLFDAPTFEMPSMHCSS